jgi:hypothetical protein
MLHAIVPGIPAWQVAFYGCNIVAFAALLVRIISLRLAKSYPALVVWLAANAAFSSLPWIVRMDFLFYHWFFIYTESFELLLYLLTVLELYGKILKTLPGVASTARIFIQIVVPASAIGSALLLAMERHPVSYLDWFYRVDGAVITTLVLSVLMITAFMVWFPIRVSRNTVIYSIGYAVYMVPKGASLFLMNSGHGGMWLAGAVGMAMSTLCLLFWAVTINRAGEGAMLSPGSLFHSHDGARLITQLEAINRTLLRVAR